MELARAVARAERNEKDVTSSAAVFVVPLPARLEPDRSKDQSTALLCRTLESVDGSFRRIEARLRSLEGATLEATLIAVPRMLSRLESVQRDLGLLQRSEATSDARFAPLNRLRAALASIRDRIESGAVSAASYPDALSGMLRRLAVADCAASNLLLADMRGDRPGERAGEISREQRLELFEINFDRTAKVAPEVARLYQEMLRAEAERIWRAEPADSVQREATAVLLFDHLIAVLDLEAALTILEDANASTRPHPQVRVRLSRAHAARGHAEDSVAELARAFADASDAQALRTELSNDHFLATALEPAFQRFREGDRAARRLNIAAERDPRPPPVTDEEVEEIWERQGSSDHAKAFLAARILLEHAARSDASPSWYLSSERIAAPFAEARSFGFDVWSDPKDATRVHFRVANCEAWYSISLARDETRLIGMSRLELAKSMLRGYLGLPS
jgi:hypothetical protein